MTRLKLLQGIFCGEEFACLFCSLCRPCVVGFCLMLSSLGWCMWHWVLSELPLSPCQQISSNLWKGIQISFQQLWTLPWLFPQPAKCFLGGIWTACAGGLKGYFSLNCFLCFCFMSSSSVCIHSMVTDHSIFIDPWSLLCGLCLPVSPCFCTAHLTASLLFSAFSLSNLVRRVQFHWPALLLSPFSFPCKQRTNK